VRWCGNLVQLRALLIPPEEETLTGRPSGPLLTYALARLLSLKRFWITDAQIGSPESSIPACLPIAFFSPRTSMPRYIAEQEINIPAGCSTEDASFGDSCARRLEKKGSDRWVERTKRVSASKCPSHYGSSRSIRIKLAPGSSSLRARALSRGSVGTLCGTGHCFSADRRNNSRASRTVPLQPSIPLSPPHFPNLLTCQEAAQHEMCIRKAEAYSAENESPPPATTVSLADAAASLSQTAPDTACTLLVRTRWLDCGKNQHAGSSPDASRLKLRPRSHLIPSTSYLPAARHEASDSATPCSPPPAEQSRSTWPQ